MKLNFFLPMNPPRTTAQQKRVVVTKQGKQLRFEGDALKDAHAKLRAYLAPYRPNKPMDGALCLHVKWLFPDNNSRHAHGEYKTTRPDTDNLQKLLKDVMTECHYWKDDAQVACEIVEKFWVRSRPGIYVEVYNLEGVEDAGEDGR